MEQYGSARNTIGTAWRRPVAVSMAVSAPSPVKPERLTLMPLLASLGTDLLYDLLPPSPSLGKFVSSS